MRNDNAGSASRFGGEDKAIPFWIPLLIAIAFAVVGQLLTPKIAGPKPDDSPKVPDIDETRPIPVLWGEHLIQNPQLFWWGDYKSVANKKKIFTGLWFKKITTGFKYELGMALALCDAGSAEHIFSNRRGVEAITEIQINEKTLWSGTAGLGSVISIDNSSFFGGNQEGGNGGVKAQVEVHTGGFQPTSPFFQAVSSYLQTQLAITPTWKGLCYIVWRGPSAGKDIGWYGNSSQIQPIAVKAYRRPNLSIFLPGLGMGTETYYTIDGPNGEKDANPVHCLAELFINDDWGMGDVTVDDFDTVSWRAAAQTLHDEGNGFSYYWDQQTSVEEMADVILRQIDGVVWTDYATGKLKIKLARHDYDVGTLPVLDNSDFLEITSLSRGSWDDTINEVRVQYTDHSKNFKSVTVFDQDLANFVVQENEGVNTNLNYRGCSNEVLARKLARRDLQVLAQPLLKFSGIVDRTGHVLAPGALFVFSWPEEGIASVVMRVTTVKAGTLENGSIQLECVEDKFAAADSLFTNNTSGWTDPVGDAVKVVNGTIQELPYFYAKDTLNRIMSVADRPNASQQAYHLSVDDVIEETAVDFTPSGTLATSLPFHSSVPISRTVLNVNGRLDIVTGATGSEVNLVLIDDEIIGFTTGLPSGTLDYDIAPEYRGMLGTTPAPHAAGARVWFIGTHFGRTETDYPLTHVANTRFLTQSLRGTLDPATSDLYSLSIAARSARPYAPGRLQFNSGVYYGTPSGLIPNTGDVTLQFSRRNRLTEVLPSDNEYLQGDHAPEFGSTTTIKIYGDSNVLLRTVTGLTGTTYTYTNAMETADSGGPLQGVLTFVVYSVQNTLTSWQAVRVAVTRTGGTVPGSLPSYTPAGTYTPATTPIADIPVSDAPLNGEIPIYDAATNSIHWGPASGAAGALTVEEIDGAPTVPTVTKIKVPNGSLTNEGGGVVRVEPPTLTIQEIDGAPSVASANTLKVSNGLLTDEGGGIARLDALGFDAFDLIITDGTEVLVDEVTGNILYYV